MSNWDDRQPPGYGAPPGYGYAPPPGHVHRRPTNQLAIVSLVLAFAFPPAALVCGVLARRQLQHSGEDGEGLALAGIIIGGIATTLMALGLLLWIVVVASISGGALVR